jgi:hypothetical protein
MTRSRKAFWSLLIAALVLMTSGVLAGAGSSQATPLTGSLSLTDQTWTCSGPVSLASVSVTIGAGQPLDAIHLNDGCTGTIGSINVVTAANDGMKLNNAVNLTVGGGSITCTNHNNGAHQDGVQAMGGSSVTLSNLTVNCPTANNAALFINQAGPNPPPTNVICTGCYLFGTTSSTVFVTGHSVRSGVENSTICPSPLTYRKGPGSNPVDAGNSYPTACAGPPSSSPPPAPPPPPPPGPQSPSRTYSVTVAASPRVVTYGGSTTLTGRIAGPAVDGQTLSVEAVTAGAPAFKPFGTVKTSVDGSWNLKVTPRIWTNYRIGIAGVKREIVVNVRPRIGLSLRGQLLSVHVASARSHRGKTVFLQRLTTHGGWITLRRSTLDRNSNAVFALAAALGARVRVLLPARQAGFGYVASTSRVVRLHR